MPKYINSIKKDIVKQAIKQGKSYKQALLQAGYSEGHARRSTKNKIVKDIMLEIKSELKTSDITPEMVLRRLDEDRARAIHKGDIASAIRTSELLGKYLALWKDVSNSKVDMNVSDERRKEIEGLIARYRGVGISTG